MSTRAETIASILDDPNYKPPVPGPQPGALSVTKLLSGVHGAEELHKDLSADSLQSSYNIPHSKTIGSDKRHWQATYVKADPPVRIG
ncbi:hypothetical protein CYMTET_12811 [Cymbomonas tetramitiformis]|uniref:Uncharacterized protein n=1 Tax=Cymbomonas tetramitiformis TaxID=36881 RepID=A0AAE0GJC6_9CHLO|nr:hypothetical protein CYMTET_12811 [Cymbomonas tetramitiformis]